MDVFLPYADTDDASSELIEDFHGSNIDPMEILYPYALTVDD